MNKPKQNSMDEQIRRSLQGYEPPFDPGDWAAMEQDLDKRNRRTLVPLPPVNRTGAAIAALLLLFAVYGIYNHIAGKGRHASQPTTESAAQTKPAVAAAGNAKAQNSHSLTSTDEKNEASAHATYEANAGGGTPISPRQPETASDPSAGNKPGHRANSAELASRQQHATAGNTSPKPVARPEIASNPSAGNKFDHRVATADPTNNASGQQTASHSAQHRPAYKTAETSTNREESGEQAPPTIPESQSVATSEAISHNPRPALETTGNAHSGEIAGSAAAAASNLQTATNKLQGIPALSIANECRMANSLPETTVEMMPARKTSWQVGVGGAATLNLADRSAKPLPGYTYGISAALFIANRWSIETGLLHTYKAMKINAETETAQSYVAADLSQTHSVAVRLQLLEIPLWVNHHFAGKKARKATPYIGMGHIAYIPLNERHEYRQSKTIAMEGVAATNQNTADSTIMTYDPPLADYNLAANASYDLEETTAAKNAKPYWGTLGLRTGVDISLGARLGLRLETSCKMSLPKHPFSRASENHPEIEKRFKTAGLHIGLNIKL